MAVKQNKKLNKRNLTHTKNKVSIKKVNVVYLKNIQIVYNGVESINKKIILHTVSTKK